MKEFDGLSKLYNSIDMTHNESSLEPNIHFDDTEISRIEND